MLTITQQVKNILKASHAARNDHKELLIIYMQKCNMNLTQEQIKTFKAMPDLWTVRRTCQKIQENGEFLPDKEVEDKRYETYKQVRGSIAGSSSEETERIIAGDKEYIIKPYGEY